MSVCLSVEQPVVQEYLKPYRGLHNFKDAISKLLEGNGKSVMSLSVCLSVCRASSCPRIPESIPRGT